MRSSLFPSTWQIKPHLVHGSQVQLHQPAEGIYVPISFLLENPQACCWEDQLRSERWGLKPSGLLCSEGAQITAILGESGPAPSFLTDS